MAAPPPGSADNSRVSPPPEPRRGTGRVLGTVGEKEGEGAGAKVQASRAPTAPPSPPTPAPAPAVPTLGTPSPRRRRLRLSPSPPSPSRTAAGLEPGVGRWLPARVGERVADAHLPASGCAWKLPQSARRSGAQRFPPPLPPPPYACSYCGSTGLSVRPSSACISQSWMARRRRLLGLFFRTAGPCVPRGRRPPQASSCPQRHHPHRQVLSPRSPVAFSRAREGACKPRRRRWVALPAVSSEHGAPGARPGPQRGDAPR